MSVWINSMSNPSSLSVVEFRNSNGGNGVFVPRNSVDTVRGAGGGVRNTAPMPNPATNVMIAITTTITLETPFAPRIASDGGAPPPSAMRGASACHYLKLTGNDTSVQRQDAERLVERLC